MIGKSILGEKSSSRRYDRCLGREEWFILDSYVFDAVNRRHQEDPLNTEEWQGYIWEILSYLRDALTPPSSKLLADFIILAFSRGKSAILVISFQRSASTSIKYLI
jgi:hypothetical protein